MKKEVKTQKVVNTQMDEVLKLKEVMHLGMLENFKEYGSLQPVLFFLQDNQPHICPIPLEFLTNEDVNERLPKVIENICANPSTQAAGMILQTKCLKLETFNEILERTGDNEVIFAIEKKGGEIYFTDKKVSSKIIFMIFSTPEKTEIITYVVNEEKKEIVGQFDEDGYEYNDSGKFLRYFKWGKKSAA